MTADNCNGMGILFLTKGRDGAFDVRQRRRRTHHLQERACWRFSLSFAGYVHSVRDTWAQALITPPNAGVLLGYRPSDVSQTFSPLRSDYFEVTIAFETSHAQTQRLGDASKKFQGLKAEGNGKRNETSDDDDAQCVSVLGYMSGSLEIKKGYPGNSNATR